MTHLEALNHDLQEKGYQTTLTTNQHPTHYIHIINPQLTRSITLYCHQNNPHIIIINHNHQDLNDPNSIPNIYKEIETTFKNALQE